MCTFKGCTAIITSMLVASFAAIVVSAFLDDWQEVSLGIAKAGLWRTCNFVTGCGSVRDNILEFGSNRVEDICLLTLIGSAICVLFATVASVVVLCTNEQCCCQTIQSLLATIGGLGAAFAPMYYYIEFGSDYSKFGFCMYLCFGGAALALISSICGFFLCCRPKRRYRAV